MGVVDRIRDMCEFQGITINKLEQALGLGRGTIARWDKHKPSVEKVQAVANYFGLTTEYILTGEFKKEPVPLSENEPVDYDKWLNSLSQDELLKVIAKATQTLQARSNNT